ncbi:sensor histidine kinase [Georgenia sp. SUBG003]|uniref:sensor histidine kinase n=1 Tax=Georgenia sp. SUBG003 TaxID=1497974 RepID=UPI0004D80C35|nr:hypothetical protein DA06_04055 [Georgenia sp. SUBG003]
MGAQSVDGFPSVPGGAEEVTEDLRALAARVRAAGLGVELVLQCDPGPVAATVHRVVQEALTNVLRHAPGATAVVTVRTADGVVRVGVIDDGPGPSPVDRPGYGLVGLAERLEQVGGAFHAGPGPDGRGFAVRAEIPLPELAPVPAEARTSGRLGPDDGTRGSGA